MAIWSSQDSVETLPARFVSRLELLGTEPSEMTVASFSEEPSCTPDVFRSQ
jgi:hypothetical protein